MSAIRPQADAYTDEEWWLATTSCSLLTNGDVADCAEMTFPSRTADDDPVVAHFRELDDKRTVYSALADDELSADDRHMLADARDLAAAEMELARHRVETTPPESLRGLALQIGYALELTDNPAAVASLRSCLVALVGEADGLVPPVDEASILAFIEDPLVLGLEDSIFDGQT